MFLETSAKTGDSVVEAFLKCSKNILAKIETGELDPERIGSGGYNLNVLQISNNSDTVRHLFFFCGKIF